MQHQLACEHLCVRGESLTDDPGRPCLACARTGAHFAQAMFDDPATIARQQKEDEEYRAKLYAEAKERARLREIAQTKTLRCTVQHGSRIGLRAKGYGIGISDEGDHCIVNRLVRVQYLEGKGDGSPEASPDKRYGPLQLGDRIVKVGDKPTPMFKDAHDAITAAGDLLELTVLRDPKAEPQKPWWRDALWNYSETAYWTAGVGLITLIGGTVCFVAYKISTLEPPPPGQAHFMQEL